MKRAPRSRQRHDLYAKYHDYDSEISDLLGECGINAKAAESRAIINPKNQGMFKVRRSSDSSNR